MCVPGEVRAEQQSCGVCPRSGGAVCVPGEVRGGVEAAVCVLGEEAELRCVSSGWRRVLGEEARGGVVDGWRCNSEYRRPY